MSANYTRSGLYKLHYKLKLSERVLAKCVKHPRYNPETDGRSGIKERCSTCYTILNLFEAKASLDEAVRNFTKRASPWIRYAARSSSKTTATPLPAAANPQTYVADENAAFSDISKRP